MSERWSVEQVAAVAPTPSALAAAEPIAVDTRWSETGSDDHLLWGRCRGSGAEPYDIAVEHVAAAWRCTCPSRRRPCKHALALLLLWARGQVAVAHPPPAVARWGERQTPHDPPEPGTSRPAESTGDAHGRDSGVGGDDGPPPEPAPDRDDVDRARDERIARMHAGLLELERWLDDRMRTGLSDPALARYTTWDDLAARLVDARAGALANRVRRLAGQVGAGADWQSDVLAELGMLHLIARAGRHLGELPGSLADAVATASGWQVRRADVLAGVPDTDDWFVAGRSDRREDRIEVRRVWLHGRSSGRWAMVLSFAAYGQSLDESLTVGTVVRADIHRYPGSGLRALVGRRDDDPLGGGAPVATTIADACREIGAVVAAEPWLERLAATVVATPALLDGRWVLADDTGSLPLLVNDRALASLLAASVGTRVVTTVEWTPDGVLPLAVHLGDRSIDLGPSADPSFVGAP